MIFDWYKIFNLTSFLASGLVSRTYTVDLVGIGQKEIMATQGNLTSILYEDVMLSINLNSKNPFIFENKGVYLDESNDVWLGILVPDEN